MEWSAASSGTQFRFGEAIEGSAHSKYLVQAESRSSIPISLKLRDHFAYLSHPSR
jgi:hypothetical protein